MHIKHENIYLSIIGGDVLMGMCKKCCKVSGWLWLIAGVLFLLQDFGMALTFWKFEWYTVAFVLWGLCGVGKGMCKDCK